MQICSFYGGTSVTEPLNIDVNQKCAFLRKKIARYSRVPVVTELVVSGTCMRAFLFTQ